MIDASLLRLFEMLPQILGIMQAVVYFILVWFFGAISMKGLRKYLSFPIKIVLTFCMGFLCLVCGIALSGYIIFLQDPVLKLFQIDVTVGSVIVSVIIALAFYLMTRKVERTDTKTLIGKLKKRLGLLEGLLVEHKVPTMNEEEIRKKAGKFVPGYKFKDAKLVKTDWEVFFERGKRKAKVVMGAYDGELKFMEHEMPKMEHLISDPARLLGIGILVFVIMFSILNFRGFPSMAQNLPSLFGLSDGGLSGIIGGDKNLPEGCIGAARLALKYNPRLSTYENDEVKSMIEDESGVSVQWMYMIDYEGTDYVLAIDANFENICSATLDNLCQCMKIPFL